MEHQTYSLFELNQYVKQVIALNFEVGIWIEAEISQVSRSRNHIYIDLIEKEEKSLNIIAFSKATIWARTAIMLRKKYRDAFDNTLQEGQSVKLLITVEFHERYGYSLNIQDFDPEFTLGKIVLQREEIIKQLRKENLLNKNGELKLNTVLQKVAVLSSENAAGYQDFFNSLLDNDFDYYFDITLFTIALQGKQVTDDVLLTLQDLESQLDDFDCVVIIRGGGAKVDLAAFDNIDIARAIANFPIPIFTGIGHEIDICAADVVAHEHFKTPTAVAEFIIQSNRKFEESVYNLAYRLENSCKNYLYEENMFLHRSADLIRYKLREGHETFDQINEQIKTLSTTRIQHSFESLDQSSRILSIIDPESILSRGYSITTIEESGDLIDDPALVSSGQRLTTTFKKGTISSITI